MKKNFNPIIQVEDDNFEIPLVREWSLEKYQLIGGYCDIFTKGMKSKWDQLIYIDLFSSSGYAKIKETEQIVLSSPLIAASIPNKFNKYIFCEKEPNLYSSLQKRLDRDFSHICYSLHQGDCNILIDDIKRDIPKYSKENRVLSFCFVDPFDLSINFNTIQCLAKDLVDFIILQALHMDGNRNFKNYMNENNEKIGRYIGQPNWRDIWDSKRFAPQDFVLFLAEEYDKMMLNLGYLNAHRHQIKLKSNNVPLYYLTFYSKHPRGVDFYKRVENYVNDQFELGM